MTSSDLEKSATCLNISASTHESEETNHKFDASLFAAAGDDSLEELKRLPEGANIVARTNNLEELKAQKEKLASVNVVSFPPT